MIKFYDEITAKNKIKIYDADTREKIDFVIPNSYYINPKGFIYNCLSDDGDCHKGTKLIYPYNNIKEAFYEKKFIELNGDIVIVSLEKQLESAVATYDRIIKNKSFDDGDIKLYINMQCVDYNDPLLMKLMLGIVTSEIALYEKFIEIKKISKNPKQDMDKIIKESNDDISDILVRLCGFHKIESQIDRTITTTSLNLELFRNYLDRNFKLTIIPPILLNGEYDEFHEQLVIDKFLLKNPDYDGKILTKKLT